MRIQQINGCVNNRINTLSMMGILLRKNIIVLVMLYICNEAKQVYNFDFKLANVFNF